MKKLITVLTNRWFLQALGLISLGVIIWLLGPLVAVADHYLLETPFARLLTILLVAALWGANLLRLHWLAKRRNRELLDELGEGQRRAQQEQEEEQEEEQEAINARFDQALAVLQQGQGKRRNGQYLYELPWYIIIGPPGSGKTTALLNSGLQFPLAEQLGGEAIQGIGGTRHCDWWFTDEAVLIDTAGRFTTQDSHEAVDRAAWQQFMGLLKQHRPQQPINGAMITMSLGDLLQQTESERRQYSSAIRRRIEELHETLGIRFPVYLIFTKCDLVPGFSEFFANYGKQERAQVWGETFDITAQGECALDIADYPEHFDQLVERLQKQLLSQLHSQSDRDKRSLIFGFPGQFAAQRNILGSFLQDLFGTSRYRQAALLRGVYYTSGTQSGTPIDRLLGSLANSFGFDAGTLVGSSGRGKSYFIADLLREVIFREAEVAGVDGKLIRRRLLRQRLTYAAAVATLALGVGGWSVAYLNNETRAAEIDRLLGTYPALAVRVPLSWANFEEILPEIDQIHSASQVYHGTGWEHRLGLYQGDKLTPRALGSYHQLLERKLLPVLVARTEELILANDPADTDTLYELLKVYLMYGGVRPYDPELLTAWAQADWQQTFALKEEVAKRLFAHLQVLMEEGFAPVTLNEDLVSHARQLLSRDPLAKQVYQGVKRSLLQERGADLAVKDLLGGYGGDVFVSRTDRDLRNLVIPGMFTKQGFYQQFLPNSSRLSKEYLANNWVMGEHHQNPEQTSPEALQAQVLELYYQDYIGHWDGLLKDLRIKPVGSPAESVRQVGFVAGLDSPLRGLLEGLKRETSLTRVLDGGSAEGAGDAGRLVASASSKLEAQRQKAARVVRAANKAGLVDQLTPDYGRKVEEYFKPYHNLLSESGGNGLLDRVIKDLGSLHGYLDGVLGASYSSTAALEAATRRLTRNGHDPIAQVNGHRTVLPREVSGWVSELGAQGWQQLLGAARQELNQLWAGSVLAEYRRGLEGRYPLVKTATQEATLLDFSRFFAAQGTLDRFVGEHLESFIDTQGAQWTEKRVDGMSLGLSRSLLDQLQLAARIREVFFQQRGSQPYVAFKVKPLQLDASVARFELSLGGQEVSYRHGPSRSSELVWPLPEGMDRVRVQFEGQNGALTSRSEEGPWAWFRLLQSSQLSPTRQREVYRVAFNEQGSHAVYELRANSVINPFGDDVLARFRLPESL